MRNVSKQPITEREVLHLNKFIDYLVEKYEELVMSGKLRELEKKYYINHARLYNWLYYDPQYRLTMERYPYLSLEDICRYAHLFECEMNEFIRYNALAFEMKMGVEQVRTQQIIGKHWEQKVMDYYSKKGYFVYKIPTMNEGTVFDVLAIHNGAALLIECKHIEGSRLDYKKCGIYKKRDELDHLVSTSGTNVYIYVSSDETGTWWTTWVKAKPIFEEKGYITKTDCYKCEIKDEY